MKPIGEILFHLAGPVSSRVARVVEECGATLIFASWFEGKPPGKTVVGETHSRGRVFLGRVFAKTRPSRHKQIEFVSAERE